MIGEFEERMSWVPRWCIVRTIQKQSLAEHSFRVALAAPRFAVKYFMVSPTDYELLYNISRLALLHDQFEAFSGDIASPAKGWFGSPQFESFHAERVTENVAPLDTRVYQAVKMADLYEALVFLNVEVSLGNQTVIRVIENLEAELKTYTGDVELLKHIHSFSFAQQDPLK